MPWQIEYGRSDAMWRPKRDLKKAVYWKTPVLKKCSLLEGSHHTVTKSKQLMESLIWGGTKVHGSYPQLSSQLTPPTYQPCQWIILREHLPALVKPLSWSHMEKRWSAPMKPSPNYKFVSKKCCCFKPLSFGVVYDVAIENIFLMT